MRSSCKVNLVGVDGLLRLDGSHGNYVTFRVIIIIKFTALKSIISLLTTSKFSIRLLYRYKRSFNRIILISFINKLVTYYSYC